MGTMNLAKLQGVVRKAEGAGVQCSVTVYPVGSVNADGSLIGSPVASTLYADQDGDTVIANPLTTAASGEFSCYAAVGSYDLRFTGESITSRGVQDVQAAVAVNASNEVVLPGDTTVAGDTTIEGDVAITGDVTVSGVLTLTADLEALVLPNGGKITGPPRIPLLMAEEVTADTYAIHGYEYGTTFLFSHAGDVAVTLPANSLTAGEWFRCVNIGTDACNPTYTAAQAGTLIAPGNASANSVSFASGQRIASSVFFLFTGTKWMAINENAGCVMTVSG